MTQKALLLREVKTPLVFVNDHPIPQPGDSQILIKITVAGLNGHDEKIRDLGLFLERIGLPAVLASDVVGTVVEVGKAVTEFKKGDRVISQADFAQGTAQNGLQEYALLYEKFSAKIPDSVSDDDAATLPTNIIAPLVGLFHDLPISAPWTQQAKSFDYEHTTLLVIGGGSFSGRFATQLAKLAGIGRIVVVGGNEDELKRYGATHIIDRHGGEEVVLGRIRAVVGDELIYILDVVNMPTGQLLGLNALSSHKKGYFARLLPMPLDETKIVGKDAGYEIRNVLGVSSDRPEISGEFWKRLPGYLEQGLIIPIKDAYEIVTGLDADRVNHILDTFKDAARVKHAHVHL